MRAEGPTRAEIREVATEVFARSEFARRKGLLQRLLDWILDRLPAGGSATGAGSAPVANLLLYLLLVALGVAVVAAVVAVIRSGRWRRAARDDETGEVLEEPVRSARAWRRDAEVAEAEGRWKDAARYRYRELVAELIDRRVVGEVPGRTCGELRNEVRERAPLAAASFDAATNLFELPWYGDQPTGPEENRRLRALAAEVLAAAPARDDLPDAELTAAVLS